MRFNVKLVAGVLFLAIFHVQTTQAQPGRVNHEQIRLAIDSGNFKSAVSNLRSLRSSNPGFFAANNYDYLLARVAELSGDTSQTTSGYQSVVARNSSLSQYALWHLAQIARSIGDLVLERERLRQLITTEPASLLRESARLRLGESFLESTDYAGTISALKPLTASKAVATQRQAEILIGQSYVGLGKETEARGVFATIIMQMPDASRPDDFALAAARSLDSLDSGNSGSGQKLSPQLSESEHLLRAAIYQFNRDFSGARLHYRAIVERYPQDASVANALLQLGRGLNLEGHYDEALPYFQRVLDQYGNSASARDALASIAATYNRLKRTDDSIAAYKLFVARFPEAPNPERSYLNIIDALHEAGRYSEALDWVQQTRARFKDQIGASLALFAQMRIHLAQGSWQAVITDGDELVKFSDLGGTRTPGGTTQAEVIFLRAYALEQLGKAGDAITAYLSILDGRNEYYGVLATQRLSGLSQDAMARPLIQARFESLRSQAKNAIERGQAEEARLAAQSALRLSRDAAATDEIKTVLQRAYNGLPAYRLPSFKLVPLGRQEPISTPPQTDKDAPTHQVIADELFFLGLFDEGVPELSAAKALASPAELNVRGADAGPKQSGAFSDTDYSIAVYSLRGGLANRAVRFAEQFWKNIPVDFVLDLAPRELVELLYPAPYRASLLKHAPQRNVDPRFVLAIARQESRFQTDAKSVAAARGMMQFISATGNEIAGQLGHGSFNQDELYNPDTAVLFGSQYLSNLFNQFPGQPQAVAASYNGGPDNVARWIARSRSNEPKRYVPEIGFSQTKDYVFRVMTSFWIYEQLYNAQLEKQPRQKQ